jgi:hypothetical protein
VTYVYEKSIHECAEYLGVDGTMMTSAESYRLIDGFFNDLGGDVFTGKIAIDHGLSVHIQEPPFYVV